MKVITNTNTSCSTKHDWCQFSQCGTWVEAADTHTHTHSITYLHSHSEIMTRLGAVLLQQAFMQSKQTKRGQFPMGELPKNHNKACNNLHIHKHYQQTPTYTHSHLLAHSCTPARTHTYTFSPVHTHTHDECIWSTSS